MKVSSIFRIAILSVSAAALMCGHPDAAFAAATDDNASASSSSVVSATQPVVLTTEPEWQTKFDRFVDLKEMDFSLRYRSVFDTNNAHDFNQGQNRSIIDGKFKVDPAGKYGVVFHASTGHYFNWAYADFMGGGEKQALAADEAKASGLQHFLYGLSVRSAGTDFASLQQSGGWSMYVRRLYLDVEPVKGVEAQYGSLDINRGDASEITTYDNDGYIDGERLIFKRPSALFLDEISVTYAYMGDLFTPSFFARAGRLKQNNYHQFLARKAFAKKRMDLSFDYTLQNHGHILHEALAVNLPETRVVDFARIETYQRLNKICYNAHSPVCLDGLNGFAVSLDKKIKRVSLEGGYADIDENSGVLTGTGIVGIFGMDTNGDQYGIGKRGFGRVNVKLTPYLDATGFYTHLTAPIEDLNLLTWNKQALNAGLVFDIKKVLFHEKAAK